MAKDITPEEAKAIVAAVLIKEGVLVERTGIIGGNLAKLTGNKYEMHPEKIDDKIAAKIEAALKLAGGGDSYAPGKAAGFNTLFQVQKHEVVSHLKEFADAVKDPSMLEQGQAFLKDAGSKVGKAVGDPSRVLVDARNKLIQPGDRSLADVAAETAPKGENGMRQRIIAKGEQGNGCVPDEPTHGLPPSANGPRRGAAGCAR